MRVALCMALLSACVPGQGSSTGPIVAPGGSWSWVEFDDTRCANGTPTGLGINPAEGSSEVVIYLMGGGACWDSGTCFFAKTAWNIDFGYGPAQFSSERFRSIPLFDRAVSPFSAASFVYVPYCTGDLHVGTATQTYVQGRPTHHEGANNLDAFLKRLSPTFSNARRVFVIGTSAGGFGAQMNAWRFKAAFPMAEVHVLADSAAMVMPAGTRWTEWFSAWAPEQPPGCVRCGASSSAWVDAARRDLNGGRLALVTSEEDGLLSTFSGKTGSEFRDDTRAMVMTEFGAPTSAAYVVPGARHVFLDQWIGVQQNGVGLLEWITTWRDGVGFRAP